MKNFEENVTKIWGEEGRSWLKSCPDLAKKLEQQWGLTQLTLIPNLSYNYVLAGLRSKDRLPIILKIGFDSKAIAQEAKALQFYDGWGCVKLLAEDNGKAALLMEQLQPGYSMKQYFPQEELIKLQEIVSVIKRLHHRCINSSHFFPTVSKWLLGLERLKSHSQLGPYIDKAIKQAAFLLATQDQNVLLHGDLHHDNLLWSKERGWVAIDPKGVVGEPAYEVGAFIRNPMPKLLTHSSPKEIIQQRIHLFGQYLSIDPCRLEQWSYVQAVLAACWMIEDGLDPSYLLEIINLLESL